MKLLDEAESRTLCGRLAQWLERSPHTGEVQGSSPWSPTIPNLILPSSDRLSETLICCGVPNKWSGRGFAPLPGYSGGDRRMGDVAMGLEAGDPPTFWATELPQDFSEAARNTRAARRSGIIARPVPSTTTMPPNHIHFTSGFRYAWITGLPVSGLRPAYTTYRSRSGRALIRDHRLGHLARQRRSGARDTASSRTCRCGNTSSVARSDW